MRKHIIGIVGFHERLRLQFAGRLRKLAFTWSVSRCPLRPANRSVVIADLH
jgi:hypothetical protein